MSSVVLWLMNLELFEHLEKKQCSSGSSPGLRGIRCTDKNIRISIDQYLSYSSREETYSDSSIRHDRWIIVNIKKNITATEEYCLLVILSVLIFLLSHNHKKPINWNAILSI